MQKKSTSTWYSSTMAVICAKMNETLVMQLPIQEEKIKNIAVNPPTPTNLRVKVIREKNLGVQK
jgi:hypothetical protein